ncbi:nitrilase-related carbon-nitrogen hydrolase [Frigoriflavimonas asaccharolytica]|uniref:Omega-amidase YafV n=1 Tax=Frigoriflavimonas asaccharolytica TaxID=2735899 RepID=A0A8J8GCC2_9FLAO|nr:nitrilase-related carbon-nitrogen hydrolase [Frigoriflavimonas asaccharolytica]NRS93340.1 putative amidohydrolase [Frigoriflavimonas asaccharolytica]
MIVKGINLDIKWKSKSENFKIIEDAFSSEESDLFVLPEMFSTGFCMDAEEIADRTEESLSWMKSFAKQKGAAVCGSASVEEKGRFYNRMYFVEPSGNVVFYNKKHLFSYSGEHKIYTAGNERVIVNYKGFRILLQVCFDLRFPVFSRNNNDYDAVLFVANWTESRVVAWESLLKARAIENQAYVFGLNRIGKDGNNLNYIESSHCFFADGAEISIKNNNLVEAEFNLEKLENYRNQFPFLDDRDEFYFK